MHPPAVVLITGASDGLGRALALSLAPRGTVLLLHGRHQERLGQVLESALGGGADENSRMYVADLARLDEVSGLADSVCTDTTRLDCLVNNAGIGPGGSGVDRQLSADGVEMHFQVNYLAPFLLSRLLLPLLTSSAPARIVNVVSAGQQDLDLANVELEACFSGWAAYRQSKLALVMDTIDLAAMTAGMGVTVTCLHPATMMDTTMVREIEAPAESTVADGVHATLRQIEDPEIVHVSGAYFDQLHRAHPRPQAADMRVRRWLHDYAMSRAGSYLAAPAVAVGD